MLDEYQEKIQALLIQVDCCEKQLECVWDKLDHWIELAERPSELYTFLIGERLFVDGKFTEALRAYMKLQESINKKFLCFRTAGYLCEERGWFDKGLPYLEQALRIRGLDYVSLKLLYLIYVRNSRFDKAEKLKEKIDILLVPHVTDGNRGFFTISRHELQEMDRIFQSSQNAGDLFEGR